MLGCFDAVTKVNIYQKDPPLSHCLRAHTRRNFTVQKFHLTQHEGTRGGGNLRTTGRQQGDLGRGLAPPTNSLQTAPVPKTSPAWKAPKGTLQPACTGS